MNDFRALKGNEEAQWAPAGVDSHHFHHIPSIYLPFSLCRERPVLLSPQNILLNPAKSHFLSHRLKKPFRNCGDMVMWHRRPALHLAAGPHPLGEVGTLSSPCLKRGRMMVGPKEVPGSLWFNVDICSSVNTILINNKYFLMSWDSCCKSWSPGQLHQYHLGTC